MNAVDYDVHGVRVRVEDETGQVAGGLHRRLCGFPVLAAGPPDLRLRYVRTLAGAGVTAAKAGAGRTVYETPDGDVRYDPADDVLSAAFGGVELHADLGAGTAVIASRAFTGRERYLAVHPLATVALIELLERHGRFSLHAGCAAHEGRGVVIAGPSGAGKSTLVLALIRAGLDHLSDDMVFLHPDADGVEALGFSDAVGVTAATRERFPEVAAVAPTEREPGFPKHLVRIEEAFACRVARRCRPVAVVFPEIVPGPDSALEAMDPGEAWMRLVPDVLLTHPQSTQEHLGALTALTEQVTCLRLEGGADVDRSARLITAMLRASVD